MRDYRGLKIWYLGYGLLEAWSLCLIYTCGANGLVSAFGFDYADSGFGAYTWISTAGVVAMTLAVTLLGLRSPRIFDRRAVWSIMAGAISVLGTALLLFAPRSAALAGLALTGIGNAWLWVSWGDVFASLDTAGRDAAAIGSAALQAAVATATMLLPRTCQITIIVLLIPTSCLFYMRARPSLASEPISKEATGRPTPSPTGKVVLLIVLGYCVPAASVNYLLEQDAALPTTSDGLDLSLIVGMLLFVAVFKGFVHLSRRLDVASFCRGASSLAVAVILAMALGLPAHYGSAIAIACELLCQYFILVYCGRLASESAGEVPVVFGLGMLANHASGLVGALAALCVTSAGAVVPTQTPSLIIIACLFFLVVAIGQHAEVTSPEASASDGDAIVPSEECVIQEIVAAYGLTAREAEILRLLAKGRSAPFIRDELAISLNTVNYHVKNIYGKIGIHSRQELRDLVENSKSSMLCK